MRATTSLCWGLLWSSLVLGEDLHLVDDISVVSNTLLRSSDLPDFVGFSYSRASKNPPSPRFIHFLEEVSIPYFVPTG